MALAAMIRSLSIFAAIPDDERELLSHYFVERRLPSEATLPTSLDDGSVMLVIVMAGSVEWRSGSMTGIVNLWPGATFGDLSTEYRFDASVSVVARGPTVVAMLSRRRCEAFVAEHPSAAVSLLRAFAHLLHLQQRDLERGRPETRCVPPGGFVLALLRRFFR